MVNVIHYQHTHYFSPPTQFDEEPQKVETTSKNVVSTYSYFLGVIL
ncbi:hypothetical protein KG091_08680 [Carnobacteriaceae bacterium zg-ZUI78]|nr:hypothetical protein [Carnobacteriaceae bacterium zg-ZUI78]